MTVPKPPLTMAAVLCMVALAGPALAWTTTHNGDTVAIMHQANGLTIEMGCTAQRAGELAVRITGLNATNIDVLTVRIVQPDGSANDADVAARGSATTVEGRLNTPRRFLEVFGSGVGFQLLADGVLVMDTNLDGTAVARSRIGAVCGF